MVSKTDPLIIVAWMIWGWRVDTTS